MAWCRSIVRLEVLRIRQKRHKDRTLVSRLLEDSIDQAFDEYSSTESSSQDVRRRKALVKCLSNLTNRGRLVLQGRFAESLSYEQIGEKGWDESGSCPKVTLSSKKTVARLC